MSIYTAEVKTGPFSESELAELEEQIGATPYSVVMRLVAEVRRGVREEARANRLATVLREVRSDLDTAPTPQAAVMCVRSRLAGVVPTPDPR